MSEGSSICYVRIEKKKEKKKERKKKWVDRMAIRGDEEAI